MPARERGRGSRNADTHQWRRRQSGASSAAHPQPKPSPAYLADFSQNGYSEALELEPVPIPLTPNSPGSPLSPRRRRITLARAVAAAIIFALLIATMVALLAATIVRCRREGGAGCLIPKQKVPLAWGGSSLWPPEKEVVSRIAFGSCSAYDVREQPIWEQVRAWARVCRILLVRE